MPQTLSLPIVLCLISAGLWIQACYIARIVRDLAFDNLYYVRESNLAVDAKDNLFGEDGVPAVMGRPAS